MGRGLKDMIKITGGGGCKQSIYIFSTFSVDQHVPTILRSPICTHKHQFNMYPQTSVYQYVPRSPSWPICTHKPQFTNMYPKALVHRHVPTILRSPTCTHKPQFTNLSGRFGQSKTLPVTGNIPDCSVSTYNTADMKKSDISEFSNKIEDVAMYEIS